MQSMQNNNFYHPIFIAAMSATQHPQTQLDSRAQEVWQHPFLLCGFINDMDHQTQADQTATAASVAYSPMASPEMQTQLSPPLSSSSLQSPSSGAGSPSAGTKQKRKREVLEEDPEYIAYMKSLQLPDMPELQATDGGEEMHQEFNKRIQFRKLRFKAEKEATDRFLLQRKMAQVQLQTEQKLGPLQEKNQYLRAYKAFLESNCAQLKKAQEAAPALPLKGKNKNSPPEPQNGGASCATNDPAVTSMSSHQMLQEQLLVEALQTHLDMTRSQRSPDMAASQAAPVSATPAPSSDQIMSLSRQSPRNDALDTLMTEVSSYW